MGFDLDHHVTMSDSEFNMLYTFLKGKYGIDMGSKKEIMSGRLENYIRQNGYESYMSYIKAIKEDSSGQLEKELVNMLSTNHTYFMRESEHFDFLKREVLPNLRISEKNHKDLCVWCGAASTGQEPYCLAMLLIDFFGLEHKDWDTKVLATDVSTAALEKAIAGVYEKSQIEKIPTAWQRRFFRENKDGMFEITNEVKQEVIFRKFNLMNEFPFRKKMHFIFLRNVLIYFDQETRANLARKLYDILRPGGYLFIGQTETFSRIDVPLKMIKPSIYYKEK